MAHATSRGAYRQLTERLNRFPQGAPPSELLYRILELLVQRARGRTGGAAADPARSPRRRPPGIWKTSVAEARTSLDGLAARAILLDMERRRRDGLRPAAAHGRVLRVLDDARARRHRPEAAGRAVLPVPERRGGVHPGPLRPAARPSWGGSSSTSRRCRPRSAAPARARLRAGERGDPRPPSTSGVGICYCRHKMEHLGRACDAPMDICMTFGGAADSLIRHGYARRVDAARAWTCSRRPTSTTWSSSARTCANEVDFICNCCGCCCEAMIAARRFGLLHPVHTTNFLPEVDDGAVQRLRRSASPPARSRR